MVKGVHGSWSFVVKVPSSFFGSWSVELCDIVVIAFNKKFNMLELTGDIMFQISPRLPSAHSSNIAAVIVPSSLGSRSACVASFWARSLLSSFDVTVQDFSVLTDFCRVIYLCLYSVRCCWDITDPASLVPVWNLQSCVVTS